MYSFFFFFVFFLLYSSYFQQSDHTTFPIRLQTYKANKPKIQFQLANENHYTESLRQKIDARVERSTTRRIIRDKSRLLPNWHRFEKKRKGKEQNRQPPDKKRKFCNKGGVH